ncbi:MAG: glycosyltransferase [Gordonibacter sp.]|uniref:glycosyltransferase n=1 Tax=Gordonibacter sp. TaxID=1968902 RepID=UPI002FC9FDC8
MNIDETAMPHPHTSHPLPQQVGQQTPSAAPSAPDQAKNSIIEAPNPGTDAQSSRSVAETPTASTHDKPALPAPEPVPPTVLVMHASVGSGHRSAAMAIAQAFELLRDEAALSTSEDAATGEGMSQEPLSIPPDLQVEVIDILDWGRIVFDGDHAASLFTGATRPLYDLTWRYTLTGRLLWAGGTIWSHTMYPAFTDHVKKVRPLAIVCTHITAANVAVGARMLSGLEYPVVCVPTDYETEGLWPHRGGDLFCVATEAMAETLRPRKIPDERILITGIPTREDFRRSYDKAETRERLGLPQDKQVVLALAGAYLPRPYVHFREALDKMLPYLHRFDSMHVAIVAGNDANYARHLRQECSELGLTNVTVLEYVEGMAALMAASDLVICKSGGLVVTECLCAQVPMILLGRAYGQEKVNVNMLTATGAAMHVTTARELLDTLSHIARNPESIRAMLVNGSFLRKPDAARDIVRATLGLAAHPKSPHDPLRKKHFARLYWGGKPAHIR